MKIYTKSGDAGQTGLFGGPRVDKDDARIEAYGTIDELNAVLGWAGQCELPEALVAILNQIQNDLFAVGAELATPDPVSRGTKMVHAHHVARLEAAIDESEAQLPPLREFILPGGSASAAALHMARAVCRRAERRIVTLRKSANEEVSDDLLVYVNRLGDLLFVLARQANHYEQIVDIPWQKES